MVYLIALVRKLNSMITFKTMTLANLATKLTVTLGYSDASDDKNWQHQTVCGVVSVRCGQCMVWSVYGVVSVRCGQCMVWSVYGVVSVQCGQCAVWSACSVVSVRCGQCTVWSACGVVSVRCGQCIIAQLILPAHYQHSEKKYFIIFVPPILPGNEVVTFVTHSLRCRTRQ